MIKRADDRAAFEEAISSIRSEGAVAFANGGPNVLPFQRKSGPKPTFSGNAGAAMQQVRIAESLLSNWVS